MECATARSLLAAFAAATLEHVDAVNALTDLVTLGFKDKFAAAERQTEQTSAKCRDARLALEAHRAEHKCVEETEH
jgi:hypothetical protein